MSTATPEPPPRREAEKRGVAREKTRTEKKGGAAGEAGEGAACEIESSRPTA